MPPDGEFALMSYRTCRGAKPPFRVYLTLDPDPGSDHKAVLTVRCAAAWGWGAAWLGLCVWAGSSGSLPAAGRCIVGAAG